MPPHAAVPPPTTNATLWVDGKRVRRIYYPHGLRGLKSSAIYRRVRFDCNPPSWPEVKAGSWVFVMLDEDGFNATELVNGWPYERLTVVSHLINIERTRIAPYNEGNIKVGDRIAIVPDGCAFGLALRSKDINTTLETAFGENPFAPAPTAEPEPASPEPQFLDSARGLSPPDNERYRVVDYTKRKLFGLWDMAEQPPFLLATYDYFNEEGRAKGSKNMEMIAEALNKQKPRVVVNGGGDSADPAMVSEPINFPNVSGPAYAYKVESAVAFSDRLFKVKPDYDNSIVLKPSENITVDFDATKGTLNIVSPDGQTVLTQTPEEPDSASTVKAAGSPNDYIAADIDRLTRARALVLGMQGASATARTKQRTIITHIDQTVRRLEQMKPARVNPNGVPPLD